MELRCTPVLVGEIEGPRPIRAPDGRLRVGGWCVWDAQTPAPLIRLIVGGKSIPASRVRRPDLKASLPAQPAAEESGFAVEATLGAGVHLARFEAQAATGDWHLFRELSVAATACTFECALDEPVSRGVLRDRVKAGGWATDTIGKIERIALRYGHREIDCRYGTERPDVARPQLDGSPSTCSGFETTDFLVAGHGPVRIKAWLEGGGVRVAGTEVTFSIAEDENHPRALDLAAARVPLPESSPPRPPLPPVPADRPLNILFLLHGSFASNSALHVAALANELVASGHRCAVAVPHDVETLDHHEAPAFTGILHRAAPAFTFADGRGPDVVHAWTTREAVRRLAEQVAARHACQVVVHLEDNEQQLLALSLHRPFAELDALSSAELDQIVPSDLSHPHRSREFLARANGVTIIMDRLGEFVPPAVRSLTLWPAADPRYFHPRPFPTEFRRILDIAPDTTVLFYHGNVHAANATEVRELYTAVGRLNETGTPVTLIRTGLDHVDFLGSHEGRMRKHVLGLGQILHHRHLPPLMALADIFVQPGVPDSFNDCRFPSKLPEFFALGRPVVLPRTNLGKVVRHGIDAYVLDRADATGIAEAVHTIRTDQDLAGRLSAGAVAFAEQHFSWRRSAEALARFYLALAPT